MDRALTICSCQQLAACATMSPFVSHKVVEVVRSVPSERFYSSIVGTMESLKKLINWPILPGWLRPIASLAAIVSPRHKHCRQAVYAHLVVFPPKRFDAFLALLGPIAP